MANIPSPITSFLKSDLIAVVGVSRNPREPSNAIYRKMRAEGLSIVPVNPHLNSFGEDTCYPDIGSVPTRPDAVFIATHPSVSLSIVQQYGELGIRKVWFHRSLGDGSWSGEAADECRKHGIDAIEGGCPMMFIEPVDFGHACMRWFFQRTGKVPR